ncbi:MAG: ABC transporter ATP-binding protein [Hyphomicrobiaceae bacterium]|nr:ABC transporter ATP-binding protein [Hyphomicrobiaceae bacterium]
MQETVIRSADADAASRVVVHLNNVAIAYRLKDGGSYEAVAPATLSISEGEFVSIVGPTGCGKSTLLNAAAGLTTPSSGRVEIFGRRLDGLNGAAGYLFQEDALMPWKTAIDNVAIGLEVAGAPRRQALSTARALLDRVGLRGFADRYPHQLSGGQRKRVGLAQVLARQPKILLMDEPFGPLDAQTRILMGDLLLNLWQQDRKALLFVTHDLEEAIALSDRVVVMSSGPSSRLIGDFRIDLPRPRHIADIRVEPSFHALHREIWNTLKTEVQKAYELGEGKDL